LMPCKLQNSSGITDADELKINDAIAQAWGDNANVATGPDLTDLASDDTFHLQTNAKLLTAAERWAQKILAAWLDLLPFSHNGTWSLTGIDWVNTPTLGADLISNGAFASDTVWTKGTGWTIAAGVATHAAGTAANITQNVLTAERWYRADWDIAAWTAGNFAAAIGGNFGVNRAAAGSYVDTFRATSAAAGVRANDTAAAGNIDNIAFKQLTMNTLMAVRQGTFASCRPSVVTGTQAGVIVRLDSLSNPLYFIFGYIDGTTAKLFKCVNGVFTQVASGSGITPVAGAKLYALNPSGDTWQLWYNGVQRGTNATISDVGAGIYAGGFSTHPSNIVANLVVT
jgi:hypothetical protein